MTRQDSAGGEREDAAYKAGDLNDLINSRKISTFQYSIFVLCFLAMLIDSCDTQLLPFVAPRALADINADRSLLGTLVSAGLFGAMVSGLLGGMLADIVGRRRVILGCLALFGVATIAKGFAVNYGGLLALQFIAGLGLGGVYMNVLALTAEYAPVRARQFAVTCISMANALGGFVAGNITALLINDAGWRVVFFAAGALTLIILMLCYFGLPESLHQLILKNKQSSEARRILKKIDPNISDDIAWTVQKEAAAKNPIADLFRQGRGSLTLLLGLASIANFLAVYFVVSWTPMLLHISGAPVDLAAKLSAAIPIGALVGAMLWGRLADLIWPPAALAIAAISSVITYSLIGHVVQGYAVQEYIVLMIVLFAAGMGQGVLNAYNGMISSIYPTAMRGTALGLIVGVGRAGSIIGSLIGGALVAAQWPIVDLYYVPAAVSVLAIICMVLVSLLPGPKKLIAESKMR